MDITRRDFIGALATLGAAALMGGIGGMTAEEDGSWGESDDEPPH